MADVSSPPNGEGVALDPGALSLPLTAPWWFYEPDHPWLRDLALLERWWEIVARTVAVDFDGVLHPYTAGWKGPTPEPEDPSPGAKAFLYELVERGFRVVVFSTRCESAEGMEGVLNWLVEHDLDRLIDDVTCAKPAAVAYVDDRAVPFRGDWDESMLGVLALADGRAHGAGVPAKTPLSGVTAKEAAANMKGASGKLGGSVDGSR